eukprot:COSAG02_NODE_2570_length_8510_cov_6.332541_4_plen_176_part_00
MQLYLSSLTLTGHAAFARGRSSEHARTQHLQLPRPTTVAPPSPSTLSVARYRTPSGHHASLTPPCICPASNRQLMQLIMRWSRLYNVQALAMMVNYCAIGSSRSGSRIPSCPDQLTQHPPSPPSTCSAWAEPSTISTCPGRRSSLNGSYLRGSSMLPHFKSKSAVATTLCSVALG